MKTRILAGGLTVFLAAYAMSSLGARPDREPGASDKPITFGKDARAQNPAASTPQYALLAKGLYARQIVQAASAKGDYTVEVWSLLVSPKGSTGDAKLPGAAVLSLRSGSVEVITGERRTKLEPGATASVPEGASIRLVNTDDNRPAQLRAVVVSGSH